MSQVSVKTMLQWEFTIMLLRTQLPELFHARRKTTFAPAIYTHLVLFTRRVLLVAVHVFTLAMAVPLLFGCGGNDSSNTCSNCGADISTRLVFSSASDGSDSNAFPHGIITIAPDGTNAVRLANTEGVQPRFSPNRSKIIFVSSEGTFLIVSNADGSKPTMLSNPTGVGNVSYPAFRPDGEALIFIADNETLYTENVDGSNPRQIVKTQMRGLPLSSPVYTPDGKFILYAQQTTASSFNPNSQIRIIGADGTNSHNMVAGSQPTVSPNGSQLAFVASDQIYITALSPQDSSITQPSRLLATEGSSPTFSPDGMRVAFFVGTNTTANALGYAINTIGINGNDEMRVGNKTVFSPTTLDWR